MLFGGSVCSLSQCDVQILRLDRGEHAGPSDSALGESSFFTEQKKNKNTT